MTDSKNAMGAAVLVICAVLGLSALAGILVFTGTRGDTYEVEITDYETPTAPPGPVLEDDRLEDKNPEFDPDLIDSRPLEGWEVNASAAVISLHCPIIKPDRDPDLLKLYASYTAAEADKKALHTLPSANLIDGANKQFDDGLFAAIEVATFRGSIASLPAIPQLVHDIAVKLPSDSQARPFLGAALLLTGRELELAQNELAERDKLLSEFHSNRARSKPIGFYNWTKELQTIWETYRFLQTEHHTQATQIAQDIASVLAKDEALREAYSTVTGLYGSLSNPPACLPIDSLIGAGDRTAREIADATGTRRSSVSFLPPSTSRETELFNSLFPRGLPSGANLMAELIAAVRSGKVNLEPSDGEGWYQYQVFALETMLLPAKGQEEQKLLLKKTYKKRLVEAFKALVTKRRETRIRDADTETTSEAAPIEDLGIQPRLRVEPCVTYYLRTARAYGFVQNLLQTVAGEETLGQLHGLAKDGKREASLADELETFRQRAYGFYLISCEDIGLRPKLEDGELDDPEAAKKLALDWLEQIESDVDLKQDTRVAVPIYLDPQKGQARLWVTLGVRQVPLVARYAKLPMVRTEEEPEWQEPKRYNVAPSRYLISVDEFAEVTVPGLVCPSREELRTLCDKHKTKEAIVEALSRGEWN